MQHRGVDYGVAPDQPAAGKWRFTIYPKKEDGPKVVSPDRFETREAAEVACKKEIERGLAEAANA